MLAALTGLPSAETRTRPDVERGRFLPKNDEAALTFYRLAADQGDGGQLENNLGVLYEHGRLGLPRDDNEAAHYYKLAADQGFAGAEKRSALLQSGPRRPAEGSCGSRPAVPARGRSGRRLRPSESRAVPDGRPRRSGEERAEGRASFPAVARRTASPSPRTRSPSSTCPAAATCRRTTRKRALSPSRGGPGPARRPERPRPALSKGRGGLPKSNSEAARLFGSRPTAIRGPRTTSACSSWRDAAACKDNEEAARLFKLAADGGDPNTASAWSAWPNPAAAA